MLISHKRMVSGVSGIDFLLEALSQTPRRDLLDDLKDLLFGARSVG